MFYADLGGRLLGIFDIKKRVYGDIATDTTAENLPTQAPSQPLS